MIDACKTKKVFEHWKVIAVLLGLYDVIAVTASYFFALWFRYDCNITEIPVEQYLVPFFKFAPIYAVVCLIVFSRLRLYKSIWRFASFSELMRTAMASMITSVFHIVAITVLFRRMPISYYAIGMGIQFMLVLGVRFSYRFILLEKSRIQKDGQSDIYFTS